jgi:hypothetical protein
VSYTGDFREAFDAFEGFDAEGQKEALYGYSWMSRAEVAVRIEVLEEFEAAARQGRRRRCMGRELLGMERGDVRAVAHVIHRDLPEAERAVATRRAADWYYHHRETLIAKRAARRAEVVQPPCVMCGAALEKPKQGPIKKYCSKSCGFKAWRNNHLEEERARIRAQHAKRKAAP